MHPDYCQCLTCRAHRSASRLYRYETGDPFTHGTREAREYHESLMIKATARQPVATIPLVEHIGGSWSPAQHARAS